MTEGLNGHSYCQKAKLSKPGGDIYIDMPIILATGRLRQRDYKFKAFLDYRVNSKISPINLAKAVSK